MMKINFSIKNIYPKYSLYILEEYLKIDKETRQYFRIHSLSCAMSIKRFMDVSISSILLITLSPVILIISFLIKLYSRGTIIYKQERIGMGGHKFIMYKFRTMITNADVLKDKLEAHNESDGPVFKMEYDPRVIITGKFLRETGLDELPQLFNVIKGEMSLVGPRPAIKSEIIRYEKWQLRRLSVKPGLTCTWQISHNRHKIKFNDWMIMDMKYIDNWSLFKDWIILFKTIGTVFTKGHHLK